MHRLPAPRGFSEAALELNFPEPSGVESAASPFLQASWCWREPRAPSRAQEGVLLPSPTARLGKLHFLVACDFCRLALHLRCVGGILGAVVLYRVSELVILCSARATGLERRKPVRGGGRALTGHLNKRWQYRGRGGGQPEPST